jgi:hypothetical protein
MKYLLLMCLFSSLIYSSQEDYQLMPDASAKAPISNPLYSVTQEKKSEHIKVSHYQRNSSSDSADLQESQKNKSSHRRQGGGWIESLLAGWSDASLSEGLKTTRTLPASRKF